MQLYNARIPRELFILQIIISYRYHSFSIADGLGKPLNPIPYAEVLGSFQIGCQACFLIPKGFLTQLLHYN